MISRGNTLPPADATAKLEQEKTNFSGRYRWICKLASGAFLLEACLNHGTICVDVSAVWTFALEGIALVAG